MRQKKKALKIIGIVLFVFFVLFSIISFIFIKINFDDMFGRTEKGDYTAYLRYDNEPMTMILEWTKDMMGTGLAYVEQPYIYLYQKFLFGKNANMSALDGINQVNTPILLIHGSEDTTVCFDGAGTIAYKDEITNPNVQYMVCDGEKQNNHNRLYQSLAAITYLDELDEAYAKVYDQYDGEVPDEVRAEFFAEIDKHRTSELDEQFMTRVLSFYEESCKE